MKASVLVGLSAILAAAHVGLAATETVVVSPDSAVQFRLILREGRLNFAVTSKTHTIIEPSLMQFTVDGVDLTEGVETGPIQRYEVSETYPWLGAHAVATNHCNGALLSLDHRKSNTRYTLEVRAFDDAVAFRFIVAGGNGPRVPDEATRFSIPAGSTVWFHDLQGHYEGVHAKKDIAGIKDGEWAAPPLTFKLADGAGYAAITEAALVNYSGMALQADGQRGFRVRLAHSHPPSYPFKLRYPPEDIERLARPAAITGTITTPWRVVMIGADLNTLVNCDVVHNLCPPPDSKLFPKGLNTDWIKPGRAVWKYLDGGGSNSLATVKEFTRLAGQLGFEHHVIEGFWSRWSDAEVEDLVAYAREQHVGIWVWKHSKSLRDPQARSEFFQRCRDLGITGVKIDFFDHEAKEVINLYQALLRETAEQKLLVNFHGANKPAGEARTRPNELTREAIKGMEASKLQDRATHDATLPFTRYLAGPGDYTVMHFGNRRGNTTWTHQIATAALFNEPLLTYAAHPANILSNPGVEMIKSIPAVWDETRVLPVSEIGEVAAFARRSSDRWFLAVVEGTNARSIRIPLAFLGAGRHPSLVVHDRPGEPAAVAVETGVVTRQNSLKVELSAGGRFIAPFAGASD